jgi:hypothetical protein
MEKQQEKRKMINSRTLVALLSFVALNVIVAGLVPKHENKLTAKIVQNSNNEKRQEGNWIWWITRNYVVDGKDADLVFMGSSQMGSALYASEAAFLNQAVDTVTNRRSTLTEKLLHDKLGCDTSTFNVSIGGAMASDQYMISKSLFNSEHKPKLVVLGVNPRDFIDNSMPSASATDSFNYLSPYVELGPLATSSFPDLFGWMDWQIKNALPTKVSGDNLKAWLPEVIIKALPEAPARIVSEDGTVTNEIGEKKTEETKTGDPSSDVLKAIYGNQGEVRPGQWRVVACAWGAFKDNTDEYRVRYKNPNPAIYANQKKFFEAYLAHLKQENIKVLIVGMPSLWPNRTLLPDSFWKDFRQYMASTSTEYGANFIDISEDPRFDSKDYLDTVHLNSSGGNRLANIIVDAIAANDKLASCLTQGSIAKKASNNSWQ